MTPEQYEQLNAIAAKIAEAKTELGTLLAEMEAQRRGRLVPEMQRDLAVLDELFLLQLARRGGVK